MQRMLTPLCAALLLAPLAALAQSNAPITGRMATLPGYIPGEAYSLNTPAQATVQAVTPARPAVTPTVTSAPANTPVSRSPSVTQTYAAPPEASYASSDVQHSTVASQSATDGSTSTLPAYGNNYRPELSIWAPPTERVGDAAQSALSMQASGDHAGGTLPTLGVTAGPAFKRYVDSFSHPLPEWFQEKVKENNN